MPGEQTDGDHIDVGNISGSQGIAIGRNACAQVSGQNVSGDVRIDSGQLRSELEELYDALARIELLRDKKIVAQTATGNALEAVKDDEVDADTVVSNLQRVGETLRQANVAVEEGTSLWKSVTRLSSLLGPLVVGGARVVGGWFGVPLP